MTGYTVTNPATGEQLATYPLATDAEVEQGIADAHAAAQGWGRTSATADRAGLLRAAAQLHRDRRDELAEIIVREMGKTLEAALGEVDFAADITEYYADHIDEITADTAVPIDGDGAAVIRRTPLGALLGVMPWNFPYYQVARFTAPNLAMGNTIILKHAEQCPASAAAIARIYDDAGFPRGAYVNLYLSHDQAAAVVADPRVRGASVTGSERAGAAVAEVAGRNLKKVALELGGSDPFIVLSTDDLDAVVAQAVDARLDNTGQSCNAAKRFIVASGLYDAFVEKFSDAMAAATVGDPFDDVVLGPLSSLAAAERLEHQVQDAVAEGARVVTGGTRDRAFFAPTVLTGVTASMNAYREELFGPVGVVYRADDEDDAVRIANDTPFGLGSYLFTTDPAQAQRVAERIEAGMVFVNLVLADEAGLPFGGVKRSGTGRELGLLGADEFVNKKLIRTA
ncbi:NAD-dependent succinate-semialdehyde dehydrogenase [Microbacterium invictum]|uniref:Succinate-semialdehyde dehydrogenase/glutarate-semialdehyde dehydrogenase n=1 Tax=Microbacterium invictum TaxID=515415 RepID=A0AA40VKW5_9MICO|nr:MULTISPECIES: NAD-dependent succinate-semialdehyde dehydrogenase [Microbacterium]MBB4138317.1 succinate-semialdehyde dehydrogenase/glutarate-semialdehyde dehydrogenase [Microbacterium invictum]